MGDLHGWHHTESELPPEGVVVETRVTDGHGTRNVVWLKRRGRLWFLPDGSMYVYYTPTHWRSPPEPPHA